MGNRYHLFDVTGVELEYVIVDRDSLQVRPIADELIYDVVGDYTADVDRDHVSWSNELVSHVIELKTNGPAASIAGLYTHFHENIQFINDRLAKWNAQLLPTGAHPFMDPYTQTVIWPHENHAVYDLYNRIFDCRGHGWANLQSTHINLPFANDEEFGQLHAAIRILLPILPALTASSPLLDGKRTGFLDTRLETYRHNQDRIPIIAGAIIPEDIFTEADYETRIFSPIKQAVAPFDTQGILGQYFLNSRGAIARFDRGAIEIRTIDTQEAPIMDLAIVDVVITTLQLLIEEQFSSYKHQTQASTSALSKLFIEVIRKGRHTNVDSSEYLSLWGIHSQKTLTVQEIWEVLFDAIDSKLLPTSKEPATLIMKQGALAERILQDIGDANQIDRIAKTYQKLANCLAQNQPFVP